MEFRSLAIPTVRLRLCSGKVAWGRPCVFDWVKPSLRPFYYSRGCAFGTVRFGTPALVEELRMSSSAWPDEFGLVPLRRALRADSRATLFRLHTELFVNAPTRDGESIRSFEALALGFMPRLDLGSLVALARMLAPCADTPATVLAYLIQRAHETRRLVLSLAPRLPTLVSDLLIGEGPSGAVALAARAELDVTTQERLVVMENAAVDEALARNAGLSLAESVLRRLIARAADNLDLGRILLARGDLALADEACLYPAADAARRERIREALEASAPFQRTSLPARASDAEVASLLTSAEAADVVGLEAELNAALGLDPDTAWHLLRPERHELLALGLLVLGLTEAQGVRAFLTLHPTLSHSVRAVFDLTAAFRAVAPTTALVLIEAVLERGIARTGHRPAGPRLVAADASVTPTASGGASRAPVAAEPELQRLAS